MGCMAGYVSVARTILKVVFVYDYHDGRLIRYRPSVGW